jgi:hypothetical protein
LIVAIVGHWVLGDHEKKIAGLWKKIPFLVETGFARVQGSRHSGFDSFVDHHPILLLATHSAP